MIMMMVGNFCLIFSSDEKVYFGAIQERLLQCDYKHRLRI